ncbi:MAG: DEAD/DEAH box helicase [Nitrosopumilus sp.]|nr:DEAD/DEAH box helicase [Nitrosopumilus sp.]
MDWIKKLSSKNPKDWEEVAREIQKKDGTEIKSNRTSIITPQRKITESIPKRKTIKTFKLKKQIKLEETTNNTEQTKYRFSHSDIYEIKNKIKGLKFDTPNDLTNLLSAYEILNTQNTRDLTIQDSLKSTIEILDHQIMTAKKVKNIFNGRAILADEVGLGKTIEAGILIKEYFTTGMIKNALILTPPSLRLQWQQELKSKFNLDFVTNKDDNRFEDFDKHDMLIASLSSASLEKNAEMFKNIEWDLVIVDEAHRLKNSKTYAHMFVKELQKKFIFLLSATPVQNSIQELYNMVEIVRVGHLGTWKDFAMKYTTDKRARIVNPENKVELEDLLQQVVIRTTRDEVRKYLKFTDRIPKTHVMKPSKEESLLYETATNFVRELWQKGTGGKNSMLTLMTLQRQISSSTESTKVALEKKIIKSPENTVELKKIIDIANTIEKDTKMKELEKIIKKDPKTKYLIFTEFRDTQNYIFNILQDEGLEVEKFNGAMSTKERDIAVRKFQKDTNILVSTEAGGEGQNFQFCSNVINYDLPWNPMRVEQRVGRVHRIGQKKDVYIHNLVISDTIEEYILKMIFDKINLFKMTIGDLDLLFEEEGLKNIEREAFESYMSATSSKDRKNKFSALGDKWNHDKKKIHDTVMEFDEEVFANFKNLSSVRK